MARNGPNIPRAACCQGNRSGSWWRGGAGDGALHTRPLGPPAARECGHRHMHPRGLPAVTGVGRPATGRDSPRGDVSPGRVAPVRTQWVGCGHLRGEGRSAPQRPTVLRAAPHSHRGRRSGGPGAEPSSEVSPLPSSAAAPRHTRSRARAGAATEVCSTPQHTREPWPVSLSGQSVGPRTGGSRVRIPITGMYPDCRFHPRSQSG